MTLLGITKEAQERLKAGKLCILGLANAGAVAARYLSEASIGRLVLVDSNKDILFPLRKELLNLKDGCDTKLDCRLLNFESTRAEELVKAADAVLDGLESWQAKLLASDICMHLGKPLIHVGVIGFRFQIFTMMPGKSACLRCAFPQVGIDDIPLIPPQSARLGPVIGMAGALQALEAIKLITRIGATQGNELSKFDCLSGEFETIRGLDPRSDCPDCGSLLRSKT